MIIFGALAYIMIAIIREKRQENEVSAAPTVNVKESQNPTVESQNPLVL